MGIPVDAGRYALALAIERRSRGLDLSFSNVVFDPAKHRRGLNGRFIDMLNGLNVGGTVSMPDGTQVKKSKTGYSVTGRQSTKKVRTGDAAEAAQAALDESARTKSPDSIGGDYSWDNADQATRAVDGAGTTKTWDIIANEQGHYPDEGVSQDHPIVVGQQAAKSRQQELRKPGNARESDLHLPEVGQQVNLPGNATRLPDDQLPRKLPLGTVVEVNGSSSYAYDSRGRRGKVVGVTTEALGQKGKRILVDDGSGQPFQAEASGLDVIEKPPKAKKPKAKAKPKAATEPTDSAVGLLNDLQQYVDEGNVQAYESGQEQETVANLLEYLPPTDVSTQGDGAEYDSGPVEGLGDNAYGHIKLDDGTVIVPDYGGIDQHLVRTPDGQWWRGGAYDPPSDWFKFTPKPKASGDVPYHDSRGSGSKVQAPDDTAGGGAGGGATPEGAAHSIQKDLDQSATEAADAGQAEIDDVAFDAIYAWSDELEAAGWSFDEDQLRATGPDGDGVFLTTKDGLWWQAIPFKKGQSDADARTAWEKKNGGG